MMSMSGGWFFVVASEAIAVGDLQVALPGIGSYVARAIEQRDLAAVGWAIVAMAVTIFIYDQLLFRPAGRLGGQVSLRADRGGYGVAELDHRSFRRTSMLRDAGELIGAVTQAAARARLSVRIPAARAGDACRHPGCLTSSGTESCWPPLPISDGTAAICQGRSCPGRDVFDAIGDRRYHACCASSSLSSSLPSIWVPVGVAVGLRPAWAEKVQPVAQFLAAFPANLLFPACGLSDRALRAFARDLVEPADDPGNAVVHPVQRHRRRQRLPDRSAGGGGDVPDPRMALVARCHASGNLPLLRDRRHHRVGRRLEREHRLRGGQLGPDQAQWFGARRLYRANDGGRQIIRASRSASRSCRCSSSR